MGFQDDNVMWALIGEKGLFDPADDPASALGSLIRIIPSRVEGEGGWTAPDGNADFGENTHPAVYAKGIRSPWKGIYFRGRWIFGDVGREEMEEVNIISQAGEHFGWPAAEGPCQEMCDGYTDPWMFAPRGNSHEWVADDLDAVPTSKRSIFVGWTYLPELNAPGVMDPYKGRWTNVVTFGDTYVGYIRAKPLDAPGDDWHVGHKQWISGWAQAPDGYVYVTALGDFPPPEEGEGPASPLYRVVLAD